MTDEELKHLEALCAKASPGPWLEENCDIDPGPTLSADIRINADGLMRMHLSAYESEVRQLFENAAFIAAARTALPAALAEIRRLQTELAEASASYEESSAREAYLDGLVKQLESGGERFDPGCCAWCGAFRATRNSLSPQTEHDAGCPAFTPDGEVR